MKMSRSLRLIGLALVGVFVGTFLLKVYFTVAEGVLSFPVMKGVEFSENSADKLKFYFDTMNSGKLKAVDMNRMIKYFLAFLAIPENKLWVNLSPYEKNRIAPEALSKVDLGKDMLSQDCMLKKITSSLTNPKTAAGKKFWQEVYAAAERIAGTTKVPINTCYKVWIVPDIAEIYEHSVGAGSKPALNKQNKIVAFVKEAKLKVMMENDDHSNVKKQGEGLISPVSDRHNLRTQKTTSVKIHNPAPYNFEFSGVPLDNRNNKVRKINQEAKEIFKRELLPIIEKKVNQSLQFAPLRQMYYAFVLAQYFKEKVSGQKIYSKYINQENVGSIKVSGYRQEKEAIYTNYLNGFKQGEQAYFKGGNSLCRWFSGGVEMKNVEIIKRKKPLDSETFQSGGFFGGLKKRNGNMFVGRLREVFVDILTPETQHLLGQGYPNGKMKVHYVSAEQLKLKDLILVLSDLKDQNKLKVLVRLEGDIIAFYYYTPHGVKSERKALAELLSDKTITLGRAYHQEANGNISLYPGYSFISGKHVKISFDGTNFTIAHLGMYRTYYHYVSKLTGDELEVSLLPTPDFLTHDLRDLRVMQSKLPQSWQVVQENRGFGDLEEEQRQVFAQTAQFLRYTGLIEKDYKTVLTEFEKACRQNELFQVKVLFSKRRDFSEDDLNRVEEIPFSYFKTHDLVMFLNGDGEEEVKVRLSYQSKNVKVSSYSRLHGLRTVAIPISRLQGRLVPISHEEVAPRCFLLTATNKGLKICFLNGVGLGYQGISKERHKDEFPIEVPFLARLENDLTYLQSMVKDNKDTKMASVIENVKFLYQARLLQEKLLSDEYWLVDEVLPDLVSLETVVTQDKKRVPCCIPIECLRNQDLLLTTLLSVENDDKPVRDDLYNVRVRYLENENKLKFIFYTAYGIFEEVRGADEFKEAEPFLIGQSSYALVNFPKVYDLADDIRVLVTVRKGHLILFHQGEAKTYFQGITKVRGNLSNYEIPSLPRVEEDLERVESVTPFVYRQGAVLLSRKLEELTQQETQARWFVEYFSADGKLTRKEVLEHLKDTDMSLLNIYQAALCREIEKAILTQQWEDFHILINDLLDVVVKYLTRAEYSYARGVLEELIELTEDDLFIEKIDKNVLSRILDLEERYMALVEGEKLEAAATGVRLSEIEFNHEQTNKKVKSVDVKPDKDLKGGICFGKNMLEGKDNIFVGSSSGQGEEEGLSYKITSSQWMR